MGKIQQDAGILNEGDVLREKIGQCETAIASITPESARSLLQTTMESQSMLAALHASGTDVRAEESRLGTVQERMIKSAKPIVRALGGPAAYVAVRQQLDPHETGRWWLLDQEVAAAQRQTWQRIGIGALIVVLIGALGFLFRGVLFPPDPVGDAVAAAQAALREGDRQGALNQIELTLTAMPTSTTLLIWKGALLSQVKDPAAEPVLSKAQSGMSERDFVLEKSQVNLQLGELDQVITDTTQLISAVPNSAEAYFVRASAHEARNDAQSAMRDLEDAARIAEATGNDTLFATARVRLGMLMQNAPARAPQP